MTTVINPASSIQSNHLVQSEPVNLNNCVMALTNHYIDIGKKVWYSPVGNNLLLKNGSFEVWSAGGTVAPDHWENIGLSQCYRRTTLVKHGVCSAMLRPSYSTAHLRNTMYNVGGYTGQVLSFGCWVYCGGADTAKILLRDDCNYVMATHTGSGSWEFLTVSLRIREGATYIQARLYPDHYDGDNAAYYDGSMLVKGTKFPDNDKEFRTGSNNGTIHGATKGDRGLAFDGIDDYVSIDNNTDFNISSTISVFCWVKGSLQHTKAFVAQYDNFTDERSFFLLSGTSAGARIILSDDGTYTSGHTKDYQSSIDILNDSWHNIGFTFNAGALKMYVDGVEDTSLVKTRDDPITTIHNSVADVTVGASLTYTDPENFFAGSIDDVRIYNKVLTSEEILAEYNVAKERYT